MTTLTERQQKWFASVKAGLERDTGKTLDEWVEIAQTCPETKPRARQAWLKTHHGLGQNRAMQVLNAAFPSNAPGWDEEEALRENLWADPASQAILDALEATLAAVLPDALRTQRKGFTAWSKSVQFAAVKPVKGGTAVLGLAVMPDGSPLLAPAGKETWSERLKSKVVLASAKDVTPEITNLLQQAAAGA
jgi:ABC-type glycerol-3-phosphate transport system substrate-binding protein